MKKTLLILLSLVLLSACGPSVRVKVKGTRDGVTISTTQTSSDSSTLNVQVNPNISLNPSD